MLCVGVTKCYLEPQYQVTWCAEKLGGTCYSYWIFVLYFNWTCNLSSM